MTELLEAHGGSALAILWDILATIAVPIAAAALAAWFVGRQIRQADRHRAQDRRMLAVRAICEVLAGSAAIADDRENAQDWQKPYLVLNTKIVEAYGFLDPDEYPVIRWALENRKTVKETLDREWVPAVHAGDEAAISVARAKISRASAETLDALIDFIRGERRVRWFREHS